MQNAMDYPSVVFLSSLVAMSLSAWIGASLLRKVKALTAESREDFNVVQAATLTLLALMIGFSFSMAVGRYDQRKNYEEEEANAIGTEFVRADLLPAAQGQQVRALLTRYLEQRVLFYKTRDAQELAQINAATNELQGGLWAAVREADPHRCAGGGRYERRAELAGLHPGRVVEPHSDRRVGADGGDWGVLQLAGRLWRPHGESGTDAAGGIAGGGGDVVRADCGHRQPAWRDHSRESDQSDQYGAIVEPALNLHRFGVDCG
jgi:hypothetical protein